MHVVNTGSIPVGPSHGEVHLLMHPGDVLKSTPNVRKSPRSGLNLEERLSDPKFSLWWGGLGPAGLAVRPLDLHVVNVGSIPTGSTHSEE